MLSVIRSESLPVVVAITKTDLPAADPQHIRSTLMEHGLVDENLGGDVQMVEVSAKTGQGLDDLKEAIALAGEMVASHAPPDGPAVAAVVETGMDPKRGCLANVLVRRGSLNVGDVVVAGEAYGRVKALIDEFGKQVDKALPSVPVAVMGLRDVPDVGQCLVVVPNEYEAKRITQERIDARRETELEQSDVCLGIHLFIYAKSSNGVDKCLNRRGGPLSKKANRKVPQPITKSTLLNRRPFG